MTPPMNHADVLQRLFARSTEGIKLDLAPMRALLAALGHPEEQFAAVLVAGTNGKGSTSALLAEALRADGRRVGLYTSPHLLHFGERIRVNGTPLSAADTVRWMARIEAVESACPRRPTFFECATAMACMAFAEAQVDIAVLEVGLGGRLDATRVVPHGLSVITRIAMDHQAFLGDTLAAIAAEKAAIMEPHRPVVVGVQEAEAMAVIRQVAAARGAPVLEATPYAQLPTHLPDYQRENVGVAAAAAQQLGCSAGAFSRALAHFTWPGRYHWHPGAPALLLDGAHNPSGAQAFAAAVRADARCQGRAMAGIFSSLHVKDTAGMVQPLAALPIPWFVCPTRSARSHTATELLHWLPNATPCASAVAALQQAQRAVGPDGVVTVVGSLFLVADILATLAAPTLREPVIDG